MKRQLTPLPFERFTYADGVLSAFDSDLRNYRFDGTYRYIQPLYDDACDEGIAIVREMDRKEVRFYLERKEVRDGDLLAFHFLPEDPKATGIKSVIIFND